MISISASVVGVLLTVAVLDASGAGMLPKNWKRCKQFDPELGKCLSVAVIDALQKMENKGIPSLGVFPIDPLDVDEINIIQGSAGPITLDLGFKHLQILGIAKSLITEYKPNLKDYKIYTNSTTPAFTLVGDYSMDGRILLLPITGRGNCNITMGDLVTEHFLTGEPFKTDGKVYMKLIEYRISLKPKTVVSHFENLFNGDKALGDTMNNFMNENWDSIFAEIRPSLEDTFGAMFMEMANRIFTKVPFNEIFLP